MVSLHHAFLAAPMGITLAFNASRIPPTTNTSVVQAKPRVWTERAKRGVLRIDDEVSKYTRICNFRFEIILKRHNIIIIIYVYVYLF